MYRLLIIPALALALGSTAAIAAQPKPYVGHELASSAHISLAQAQATALKARPGHVTDKELEKEAGGSGLRYSFDIKSHGKTYEVGIDAQSGKILENKAEGPNPD